MNSDARTLRARAATEGNALGHAMNRTVSNATVDALDVVTGHAVLLT